MLPMIVAMVEMHMKMKIIPPQGKATTSRGGEMEMHMKMKIIPPQGKATTSRGGEMEMEMEMEMERCRRGQAKIFAVEPQLQCMLVLVPAVPPRMELVRRLIGLCHFGRFRWRRRRGRERHWYRLDPDQ